MIYFKERRDSNLNKPSLDKEKFNLLKQMVELTYGSQKEIDNRAKNLYKLYSVLIIKPMDQLNDSIVEYYSLELKGMGINNFTWDENLWAFRACITGGQIPKIKQKGFIVLLDRKITFDPLLPPE